MNFMRTLASAVTAAGLAVSLTGVPAQASETKAAANCWASAAAPYYYSPTVYAEGWVECLQPVEDLYVYVEVWANGVTKGSTFRQDGPASRVSATAQGRNTAGDQRWCTWVEGEYYENGAWHSVFSASACENKGF